MKSATCLNLKLDPRFGSRRAPNFGLDLGLVRPGSGSNCGSGPDHGITSPHWCADANSVSGPGLGDGAQSQADPGDGDIH
jgi:hypothetical protein